MEKTTAPASSTLQSERKSGGRKAREEGRASAAPPALPPLGERIFRGEDIRFASAQAARQSPPSLPPGVTQLLSAHPKACTGPWTTRSNHCPPAPIAILQLPPAQDASENKSELKASPGDPTSPSEPLQAPSAPGKGSEPAAVPQQGCCEPPASHSFQTQRFCRTEPQAERRKSLTRNHLPGP